MATSTPPRALSVLLAGGGSGGHVFPALAVAEELAARGCEVGFAGAPTGMEATLVPARGVAFYPLPALPLVGRSPLAKLRALWTLARATFAGRGLVRRLGSRVVVGTGGYASASAVLGGRLAGRPALLVEPNAHPGFANRRLSRWAAGAALGFAEAAGEVTCPTRITGVPVRRGFFAVPPELPAGGPRLLVLGGSQGALSLNRELPAVLATVAARVPGLTVRHQTGEKHLATAREAYRGAGLGEAVRLEPFIDDVAAAMAESHLVLSRAGAITVAEIAAAGRGAVLVPLSALAEGHQEANARAFAALGAAHTLPDPAQDAAGFAAAAVPLLSELLADRIALTRLAAAARAAAKPHAAAAIADWVEELAGSRKEAAA